jgi:hypothetical protein
MQTFFNGGEMRVRISYGVEIEDIPEQAETLGYDALAELEQSMDSLRKALANIEECSNDYSLVVEIIEKARLKLKKSDAILSDVASILEGLNKFYDGEKNVSDGRSTVDSSRDIADEKKK